MRESDTMLSKAHFVFMICSFSDVQSIKAEHGIQEYVALVVFGETTKIQVHLTDQYWKIVTELGTKKKTFEYKLFVLIRLRLD